MKKPIALKTVLGLSAILCLAMCLPCMAKSSSGCGYNVTSVLYDSDSQVTPQPFQYQSDGGGPYTTFRASNNNSVSSIIQSSCSWALDTTGSTTRGIVVTLAYPYSGITAPPPFTSATEIHGVFHTQCFNNSANNNVNFGTMTFVGQTIACPMHLVFTYNGVLYNLGLAPPTFAGTSYMQVTCAGASGGLCNQWTVQPDPATSVINPQTNQLSGIAELFYPSCNGCGTGTPIGQYLVSFSFLIHK
ncbi:MAG TPA: hypothetical protein VI424_04255 [Terriglobales bacterium]